jgi:hypothetical protein
MNLKPLTAVVPMLYAAAIVASIFAGGFLPVVIVGAILVGAFYTYYGSVQGRKRRSSS